MLRFDSEVTIRRPVADVFSFVADLSNTPLWQGGVVHSASITPGPVRVGAMFEEDVKVAWFHVPTRCVITELEANQRVVFEANSSPLEYRGEFRFEPVDGGTRLRVRGSGRMRGVWRLLEPVLQADATRTVKDEVGRIKSHLERVAA